MAEERRDEGNGKEPGSRRGQPGREGQPGGQAGGPSGGDGRSDEGRRRSAGRHRGFRGRQGQAWRQGGAKDPPEGSAEGGVLGGAKGEGSGQDEGQQRREAQGRAPQPGIRQGRGPERESAQRQAPEEKRELSTCPLCGKPLYDLSTALAANKETGEPAHFDCVLERVTAAETLAAGEKVVYLGSGAFAVVEYKDKSETAFAVKRRIQWEKEGEKKDWRRGLSSRISNL